MRPHHSSQLNPLSGLPLDTNHDGKISKDEVLKQFDKVDANGDGSITKEEIAAHFHSLHSQHAAPIGADGMQSKPPAAADKEPPTRGIRSPQAGGRGRPSAEMMFQRMDRNHDGKLSKDELPEFLWSRLSAGDSDKNGSLSKPELEEFLKQQRPAKPAGESAEPQTKPENKPADPQKPGEKTADPVEKAKEDGKAA